MSSPGDRVPHIIRGNRSSAGPQTWIVVDTETLPVQLEQHKWQHVFRLGVTATWRRERASKPESVEFSRYTDGTALVRGMADLPKSKERVGIVAHNLDYDAQVLDIHCRLRDENYRLTRAVIERNKWVQRWQRGGKAEGAPSRTLLLVDLGNFFPIPLRELADWLGMKKGKLPPFDADNETWFRYCENDVRIELAALQAWVAFCEDNDLGYFAPTIAGQAFNAFKHRFMKHDIYVHVHQDVSSLERAAYYGGRCQNFWRGRAKREQYVHVDVNSMYGAVMYENEFPLRQSGHYGPCSTKQLSRILDGQAAIAKVSVNTDVPIVPLRIGNSVRYPVGQFDTVLPGPELKLLIETGYLRSVQEVVTYEQAPIFKDYVNHFWKMRVRARNQGDDFTAKLAKRFLTALHGKFGQRIFTSELILADSSREDEIWTEYDIEDAAWYEYRSLAGRVERRVREINGRDTLIAIPAHVASYARVKLWQLMVAAGLDNVLYVDTDSLIMRREGLPRISHSIKPKSLGGVRILNQSNLLYIRAPKWYRFGREVKRSGISRNARVVEWDKFEQDYFRTLRWALAHNHSCTAIVEEVQVNAPYHHLLQEHALGHRVAWLTADEYMNGNAHDPVLSAGDS